MTSENNNNRKIDFRSNLTEEVIVSLQEGKSICIIGERGAGKTFLAERVKEQLRCAYGIYSYGYSSCLEMIAEDLGIELHKPNGRALTARELKRAISENLGDTILIADNAHRWTSSLKEWLEELHENGATLLILANKRSLKGILSGIPRTPLPQLNQAQLCSIIRSEAVILGVTLTRNLVSELAHKARNNPTSAKELVYEYQQGILSPTDTPTYRDITPFMLTFFGIIGAIKLRSLVGSDDFLKVLFAIGLFLYLSNKTLKLLFPRES